MNSFRAEVQAFLQSATVQNILSGIKDDQDPNVKEIYRILGEKRFLAAHWPKELGGRGLTLHDAYIAMEEMIRVGIPETPNLLSVHVAGSIIQAEGTQFQKQCFLPLIASGQIFVAILYSERQAGSDLASINTTATNSTQGHYRIHGHKLYSLRTSLSDFGLLAVRTSEEASRYQGLSLFMVPLNSPGITINALPSLADEKFHEVLFNGVEVPGDYLIGEEGNGWSVIAKALSFERTGYDYLFKGQRWLSAFNALCKNLDEGMLEKFGLYTAKLNMGRLLSENVVNNLESGNENEQLEASAKWYASELAKNIAWWTFENLNPQVLSRQPNDETSKLSKILDSAYREAPGLTISAGASEVMLQTVSGFGMNGLF